MSIYLSVFLTASTCDSAVLTKTRFDVRETADATVPSTWPSEQNLLSRAALKDQKALCNGWVITMVADNRSTLIYFYSSEYLTASTCDSAVLTKTRFDERETADATVPSTLLLEHNFSCLKDSLLRSFSLSSVFQQATPVICKIAIQVLILTILNLAHPYKQVLVRHGLTRL